ncbi:MAG: hypothetical protein MUF15_14200, partial [Acidobacteria bacterium]|nr:hypothetical protein [Acidobacteriota bacterium]
LSGYRSEAFLREMCRGQSYNKLKSLLKLICTASLVGSLKCLQYLVEKYNYCLILNELVIFKPDILIMAAKQGNIDILNYLSKLLPDKAKEKDNFSFI